MYLRHTTRKKNGKTHRYWRLVQSVRVGDRVIQKTVAQLGELDHAGRLRARTLARTLVGSPEEAELFDDGCRDVEVPIRLKGVRVERSLRFGDVYLALALWRALKFDCNELMQNSADHSTSERYYLYAGLWKSEMHVGVLDMGVTIPAKLSQKYNCADDLEYLKLAMQKGIGTRREREGGLGLYYFHDFLKDQNGKLTILSRNAQLRYYFATRKTQKNLLKHPLLGTWCFARFPLREKRR